MHHQDTCHVDPHLAAVRFSITPKFSGAVQLSFPIRLRSEHQSRFPIGSMSGDQMDTAQRHDDFDPSVPHDKITWMGSSLAWLMYPNLDLAMSDAVRCNDFDFQLHER